MTVQEFHSASRSRLPFLSIYISIWILAVLAYSTYSGSSYVSTISHLVDDGWCDVPRESIGKHCFSDYAISDEIYRTPYSFSQPISWISISFHWLGQLVGQRTALLSFLGLIGASVLAPIFSILRSKSLNIWWVIPLTVASAPVISVLDRGNSIGLAVAPLYFFLRNLRARRFLKSSWLLIALVMIRPQFAVFLLLLVAFKRWRETLLVVVFSSIGYAVSMYFEPGSFGETWYRFVERIVEYGGYQSLLEPAPMNLSISRSIVTSLDIFGLVGRNPGLPDWLESYNNLIFGVFLVALSALVIRISGPRVSVSRFALLLSAVPMFFPSTVFFYYTVLLVPVLAFCLLELVDEKGYRAPNISGWLSDVVSGRLGRQIAVSVCVLFVFFPFPITTTFLDWFPESWKIEGRSVFVSQLLAGPAIFAIFLSSLISGLAKPETFQNRSVQD